jgi:kynurenine 3-monooxygenase
MSFDKEQTIYLAGAGLAGCVLACYLSRRGYAVQVYEKRADMRREKVERGRSINLALSERGIVALGEIGVLDEVMAMALPMRGRMIHDREGKQSLQPYSAHADEVIHSVHRGQLNQILIGAAESAGVRFHFDCPIESLDPTTGTLKPAGRQAIELTDSPLFGCDGAGSVVRQALESDASTDTTIDWLPHGYQEFNIPPDGNGQHRLSPDALHIWPRHEFMLIALPNPDGSFTATLFLAHEGERRSFAAIADPVAAEIFFRQEFPDFMDLVGDDFRRQHAEHPVSPLGTVRCAPWHHDHIALVGDAAHAVVPFHGQGMNCAFEDCTELNRLLDEDHADWSSLLAEYERRRKPNADAIADMALENYIEMRDKVADPTFQLQKQIEAELYTRLPKLYVPRYAMVMFRTLPYAEAQARGRIQAGILDELTRDVGSLQEVDLDEGERLVRERLGKVKDER